MARTASERLRRRLVADLRVKGAVSSPRVAAAFLSVARERFLPEVLAEEGLAAVYRDEAIVTKRNPQGLALSSSSQPALMAKMLDLLDVQPGSRVLEIGAGSGYNAALLAHLADPSGQVTSIDIDPDLAGRARRALRDTDARATIVVGDGRNGHIPGAPYDRIIATAGSDEIPRAWLDQLVEGGRLELPLRLDPDRGAIQLIPVLERQGNRLRSVGLTWGGFMPLHAGDGGWRPPPFALRAAHTASGQHTTLTSVTGAGLKHLSPAAGRGLLVSLLGAPGRPRREGVTDLASDRPPLLLLYLLLSIPAKRRVLFEQPGRWGVGIVDRRTQSTAVVSLRSPWSADDDRGERRARWRLDAYNGDSAATELDQIINQWRALERTGQTTLRIIGRGRASMLRLTFEWVAGYD